MMMKTQIFDEALSSLKEHSFLVMKQSAIQVFYNIVRKVVSMSDCKEWFTISLIIDVNVLCYELME